LKIAWKHPAEVFYQLYRQEVEARMAKRWQALWMLRRGERFKRVKEMRGQPKPIQQILRAWYGTIGLFPRGRRWKRWGCGGCIISLLF
jgi:hypothetical protein